MNSQKQTFLAFILAGILCVGFVGVYYVDAYYEQNEPTEILWTSDSDATMGSYEKLNEGYLSWTTISTGQLVAWSGTPYVFETYNRTSVYMGNNTWTYSANTTSGNIGNIVYWVFNMPNLDNMIITDINYSFSTNGDSDLQWASSMDYPVDYIMDYDRTEPRATTLDGLVSISGGHYYRNVSVPLATALDINSNANNIVNVNPMLICAIHDENVDGMTGWASSMKIVIHGYKVDTTSMVDQIALIIGISIALNVMAIVFLQDAYDVGGYVKDIPKRRK